MPRNDNNVRDIVNLISTLLLDNKYFFRATTTPDALLEKHFLDSLKNLLRIKKMFLDWRWNIFIETHLLEMLSSHQEYIAHVMKSCCLEEYVHNHIFERFLNVCCVTNIVCKLTHCKTGVNFEKLNLDIFMVYYEKNLKKKFNKFGGFRRLVEYIRQHKFATCEAIPMENLGETFIKEVEKISGLHYFNVAARLAADVLFITKAELPVLPSAEDLSAKLLEVQEEKSTKKQMSEEILPNPHDLDGTQGMSFSNSSHSKTELPILPSAEDLSAKLLEVQEEKSTEKQMSEEKVPCDLDGMQGIWSTKLKDEAEPKMDNAQCEKIVEAVGKYNYAKSLCKVNSNNFIQMEASSILQYLKDNIKSVIEFLDQIDKE